jgi:hypothetical protein
MTRDAGHDAPRDVTANATHAATRAPSNTATMAANPQETSP